MADFKMIAEVGPFVVYKGAGRVVIYEGDEMFVQFFRGKGAVAANYADPAAYCRDVLAAREEYEADKAAQRGAFRKALAAARAERAAKVARQGTFAW